MVAPPACEEQMQSPQLLRNRECRPALKPEKSRTIRSDVPVSTLVNYCFQARYDPVDHD